MKREKQWKYTAGIRPHKVAGYERVERRNEIWIRYGERRQRLTDGIRDERGRIDPHREAAVISLIAKAQEDLKAGRLPGAVAIQTGPVTLRQAFDTALAVGNDGLYVVQSQQWADMRSLAIDICDIFGPDTEIESIGSGHAQKLWRAVADQVARGKTRTINTRGGTRVVPYGGPRMAVRAVDFLFRVLKHHYSGKPTPPPRPPFKWMELFEREWTQRFGSPVVSQPRHSPAQVAKMLANLKKCEEPRLSLLLELAAETRLGQARRCTRKDLKLAPGAGVLGYGELTIASVGKKKGTIIDLTKEQRALIDRVMKRGYLQDFEDWYQMGRIKDYPLFPKGRFLKGVATVRQMEPITRDGLRGWFQDYEAQLGIPHVPGRGWYGVRRQAADLAEDATSDTRALNLLTGHSDERMRRKYQDRDNPVVRRLALETRLSIRKSVQPVPKVVPPKKRVVQVQKRKRP